MALLQFILGLGNVFHFSYWLMMEVSVIFNILFHQLCHWELILCEIRLNTIFSLIFNQLFWFPKNMGFWIKFPFVISFHLLSWLIVPMSMLVQFFNFLCVLNLKIIWSNHILCIIIIKGSFISIRKIWLFDSFWQDVVSV